MKKSELIKALVDLEKEFNDNKHEIYKQYAESNNPYKVGDIISDYYHSIKIVNWRTHISLGTPELVYYGVELKKDGTPNKKQNNTTIYQSNIKQ